MAKKNSPKIRRAKPWLKCTKCHQPLSPPFVAPGDHRVEFTAAVEDAAAGVTPLDGVLLCSVVAQWPTKRDKDGPAKGRPMGDADAPISGVLDALTKARVYHDDGQVAVVIAVSAYSGKPGGMSVLVRQLEQADLEVLGELIGEQLTELQVMVGRKGIE